MPSARVIGLTCRRTPEEPFGCDRQALVKRLCVPALFLTPSSIACAPSDAETLSPRIGTSGRAPLIAIASFLSIVLGALRTRRRDGRSSRTIVAARHAIEPSKITARMPCVARDGGVRSCGRRERGRGSCGPSPATLELTGAPCPPRSRAPRAPDPARRRDSSQGGCRWSGVQHGLGAGRAGPGAAGADDDTAPGAPCRPTDGARRTIHLFFAREPTTLAACSVRSAASAAPLSAFVCYRQAAAARRARPTRAIPPG